MSRKTRVWITVIVIGAAALFMLGYGLFTLLSPVADFRDIGGSVAYSYNNPIAWLFIVSGIIILFTIPSSIRGAHRKADLDEMLDEYQQKKRSKK